MTDRREQVQLVSAPHEATLRRMIQSFDAPVLDAVISRWLPAWAAARRRESAANARFA